MEKEDKLMLAAVRDKLRQCDDRYALTSTPFLDIRQRILAEEMLKKEPSLIYLKDQQEMPDVMGTGRVRCVLYGGYDDAERRVAVFLPDYYEMNLSEDGPLTLIRATASQGGKKLSHRDYLGSLLGLGLKREVIGDIIARDSGADIIVLKEIKDFLLFNYEKAGRTGLKLEELAIGELEKAEIKTVEKRDTVASLRLDNIVSSIYGLSRGKAQEGIKAGVVFVNSVLSTKPDMIVNEGDKIVFRGKGKAVLSEVSGLSRKDRICIVYNKYL